MERRFLRTSILALVVMFGLMLPLQQVAAHGGGLNRAGCHNETATGGYHCHRNKKDDFDWAIAGAVAGGALVLWFLVECLDDDENALASRLQLVPHFNKDEAGIVCRIYRERIAQGRLPHPDAYGRPRGYLSRHPLAAGFLIYSPTSSA